MSVLFELKTHALTNNSSLFYCVCSVTQSCLTLCDPMDCIPPGFTVPGIVQASILEWVAISSPREPSLPRDHTCISRVLCTGRQILYHRATWEALLTISYLALLLFLILFFFSFDSASTRLSSVSLTGIIPYYYAFEFKSSELVK